MVQPGLDPPPGETSNFDDQQSSVKAAALAVDIAGIAVYATMVIYGPTVFATKASILFFLTRVFKPYERYCRLVYAFTLLMGCYYSLMLFLKIFICRPIHLFWDSSEEGQCFNQRALILADNVISLISDIAVLLIPCPLAGGLKIALAAKLRIAAVFGAGGLACVCTFIRLIDIVRMGASPDQTYSFTLINLWGIAEVGIGLVCACFPVLPAFWKYLRKTHPSQTGAGGSSSAYYHRTGGQSHPSRSGYSQGGGVELAKKSHRTTVTTTSSTPGPRAFANGSDENMLIPRADGTVLTSVRAGEDLALGRAESGGADADANADAVVVGGRGLPGAEVLRGQQQQRRSAEDGIVRTVEVQMMREPK